MIEKNPERIEKQILKSSIIPEVKINTELTKDQLTSVSGGRTLTKQNQTDLAALGVGVGESAATGAIVASGGGGVKNLLEKDASLGVEDNASRAASMGGDIEDVMGAIKTGGLWKL